MSFSYNGSIPQSTDNPSVSQGQMLTNFASISSLIDVDHVTFNNSTGGQHEKITINSNNVQGSVPAGSIGVAYTNAGTASTSSDLFWRNASGVFPLNFLRACGSFTTSASPSFTTQFNCSSISGGTFGPTLITLTSNAVTGNNVMVLISSTGGGGYASSFSGGVLSITVGAPAPSDLISFFIFQI